MRDSKKKIRTELRRRLAGLSEEGIASASARIADRLCQLRCWREARVVFVFLSMEREVQTQELIERAWTEGKRVAVPRMDWERGTMSAVEMVRGATELERTRHGMLQPARGQAIAPEAIDLVLTPGVAFDGEGGRLGRGGGFYDRFLAQAASAGRAAACGLAFECQCVDEPLPGEPTDAGVDLLVTESDVRGFTRRGAAAAESART